MKIDIIYASEQYFKSFHKTLDTVAKEKIHLALTAAYSLDETTEFQAQLIQQNLPVFYAIREDHVIGWIDISRNSDTTTCHIGEIGMGLLSEFRGQGLGYRLLKTALSHAKAIGLEKIELTVYTMNTSAIALYKKAGFVEVGIRKKCRKLDGDYSDCLLMEKFL